ncbi:hypothetical protein GUJ93_ZPchr0009g1473 [Zizania palustris]|uniref:SHSP domain-containing protein n=1 Tax=Zizania palustris TaxID=103762 RepID=A0A8J5S4I9_ZIZPA|nr:hypothetical protein GUJ93_ZPchr0009g1473 [Zizania palustris]
MDIDLAVQVSRRPDPGEDFAFATSENDAAFLVLAHLPGYGKEEVEVRVREGGTEVGVIVGARKDGFAVEAAVGRRLRVAHWEVVEGFSRVFDVPPGVEVGMITVGFEEDDELLVVIMPKVRPVPAYGGGDGGGDEGHLDIIESTDKDWVSSDVESCEIESEPERQDDIDVEEEVELDDGESSSLELEYEDWIDLESSESEPPGDVPVETPVALQEPEPEPPRDVTVEAEVAVETPVEVEEEPFVECDVAVETPVVVEEPPPPPPPELVDIECDVVFESAYRELPVETPIEVTGPPHAEPEPPDDVPDPIDIPCDVDYNEPPDMPATPAAVNEPEEPKPQAVDPAPPAQGSPPVEPHDEEPTVQETSQVQPQAEEQPVAEQDPPPPPPPANEPHAGKPKPE